MFLASQITQPLESKYMYSGRYISRNVTLINFWTFVTVLRDLFP